MSFSTPVDVRLTEHVLILIKDIYTSKGGALTKWNKIVTILRQKYISYKRLLRNVEVIVHPRNRGGLGVNAHNVHKNFAAIKAVGCDKEHLKKATAFELAPDPPAQGDAVEFNKLLVLRSGRLLAPLFGQERYVSVSCSHTVAGCRAVLAGCPTPQETLQDPEGHMCLTLITKDDPVLHEVVTEGWVWEIIPWALELAVPGIADLAQAALNADHAAISMASELQVLACMSNYAQELPDGENKWDMVIDRVKESMPPCMDYLDSLCEFCRYFSGGAGAPIVTYQFKMCLCVSSIVFNNVNIAFQGTLTAPPRRST